MNVTGEYLTKAIRSRDGQNRPAIQFSLNRDGAARIETLTGQNLPNVGGPNLRRRLGIILDKQLLSAPMILSRISDSAAISGGSMSDREVDNIVTILNSGSLPCSIRLVDEKRVTEQK
jgi:preprotein translocase subunit SecD